MTIYTNNNMTHTTNTTTTYRTTFKDEKFASIAMEMSKKSNMNYSQHGCVAVANGKIIARGYNVDRTYSRDGFLKDTCSCHAEMSVMRQLVQQGKFRGFKKKGNTMLFKGG